MEYLQGGRPKTILYEDQRVYRPSGTWSLQVHKFLKHLRNSGFSGAPEPLGFTSNTQEIVSYIDGEVSNYPLSANAASTNALISAAKLLKAYHDASQTFLLSPEHDPELWQICYRNPQEVICHGDFAPYNVVLKAEEAIGIIDFDTSHAGPRVWDIAYALYRWSPLKNPDNPDGLGNIEEQIKRARLFCDAYGLTLKDRKNMPCIIIERLHALVDFMHDRAQGGMCSCKPIFMMDICSYIWTTSPTLKLTVHV